MRWLGLFAAVTLSACGPMSLERAENYCFRQAELASGPKGHVALGLSGGKPASAVEVNVSSDWLLGKDPSAVYDSCVMAKSGEAPRRPLYHRSDWKG